MNKRPIALAFFVLSIVVMIIGTLIINGVQELTVTIGRLDGDDLVRFAGPARVITMLKSSHSGSLGEQMVAVHAAANTMGFLLIILLCTTFSLSWTSLRKAKKTGAEQAG